MFYGITESESFNDPRILNQYKHHKVVVEKRTDKDAYWHIFVLIIEDKDIEEVTTTITKNIKSDWSAMFFNDELLYAVLGNKVFKLKRENPWKSPQYLEIVKHAKKVSVGDLDLNEAFKYYEDLIK